MSNVNTCDKCGGDVHYDKSCVLYSSPSKYKGRCKTCSATVYVLCSAVDTASIKPTESTVTEKIRLHHLQNIASNFLNETKAINLERDLIDFLVSIDKQFQTEIEQLNLLHSIALSHANNKS